MSADSNSKVVTGGSKGVRQKLHLGPRVRLALVLLVVLVLLLGLAGGAWWVAKKLQKPSKIPKAAATMTINGKPLTDKQKSEQAIYYGEYDKGQSILKDQVAKTSDSTGKVALYMQLATNALNKQKYDDANGYAQKALALQKTAGVYSLLAQVAAKQGDKPKAQQYASQWKAALDPKAHEYNMELSDINEFLASLNK